MAVISCSCGSSVFYITHESRAICAAYYCDREWEMVDLRWAVADLMCIEEEERA